MKPLTPQERQILFPAAVRLSGFHSVEKWCQANELSVSYVYQCIRGMRATRIEKEVDRLILDWFGGTGSVLKRLRSRLQAERRFMQSRGGEAAIRDEIADDFNEEEL